VDYALTIHAGEARYWCAAIVASAVVTIVASLRGWRSTVYVFKPLTTLLIVGLALARMSTASDPAYALLIVAGLLCSLAGDVLLMLPRDRFVAGLAAFLIAHLLYLRAFTLDGVRVTWWIVLPLAAVALILLRVLLPHVAARLRAPVVVYALALTAMAWSAGERGAADAAGGAFAAAGGVLFVASDSALAIDRFARPFRAAPLVVLATYFAAQTLIALSIR
jgi:uncharacterized membrane protein YhhN